MTKKLRFYSDKRKVRASVAVIWPDAKSIGSQTAYFFLEKESLLKLGSTGLLAQWTPQSIAGKYEIGEI